MAYCHLICFVPFIFLLSCISGIQSCPISTCAFDDPHLPSVWMNSTVMASLIRGLNITSFPRESNGNAFTDAFVRLTFDAFQELALVNCKTGGFGCCNTALDDPIISPSPGVLLQNLNISTSCCEVMSTWEIIEGTSSNKSSTVFNITNPDWPDMYLLVSYSNVNETVIVTRNGSSGTYNLPYNITYSADSFKINLEMHNWPWNGSEVGGQASSALSLFLSYAGEIDGPNGGDFTIDDFMETFSAIAHGQQSYLDIEVLNIFTADGVDYNLKYNGFVPNSVTVHNLGAFATTLSFPFCHAFRPIPYWNLLVYDPSLTALFTSGPSPQANGNPPSPSNPASSKSVNPAAYAVPIVVFVILLVAVFMVIYMKSPKLRAITNPFSIRNNRGGSSLR